MSSLAAEAAGRWLTFRIVNDRFALPAGAVREVVRPPATIRVPHAPDSLVGLANLRGQMLPVVSLARLLGRDGSTAGRLIVLDRADPVGLLVDEVSGVVADGAADRAVLLDLDPLLLQAFKTASAPRRARPGVVAAAAAAVRADHVALLAFAVGDQEFALPIGQVEEVLRLPPGITRLPMSDAAASSDAAAPADAAALGAIARRDRLLPLLSLRALLGLAPVAAANAPRVLIVRVGAQIVGLVVDAVRAILRVAENQIDAVPTVLSRGRAEARIQAICRLDGGGRLVSILATDHLLHADLTRRLMQNAADEGDAMEAGLTKGETSESRASAATEQFLIFRVGGQEFAMPIAAVREVAVLPDTLTRIPTAPAFVRGIMNLRGQAIPVIDQARCFDAGAASGRRCRVIVLALGDGEAGLLVDAVVGVLRIPVADLGAAPDLAGDRSLLFDRVANLDGGGRMILIVAPRELLDRAERDLLAAMAVREGVPAS